MSCFFQALVPSPWYIVYLCVVEDDPGDFVTPFHFASLPPAMASNFFRIMFAAYQSLHFYAKKFHLQNEIAADLNRFSYAFLFCQKRNLTAEYVDSLQLHPSRVIYTGTPLEKEQVRLLLRLAPVPFIVCADVTVAEPFKSEGAQVYLPEDLSAAMINAEIGQMFKNATASDELHPVAILKSHGEDFSFVSSGLPQTLEYNLRVTSPNQILSNHLKRSFVPDARTQQPSKDARAAALIESIEDVFCQRLANQMIVARIRNPSAILPDEAGRMVAAYLNSKDATYPASYDKIVEICRSLLSFNPDVCKYILCCPCVNREVPLRLFGKSVSTRVSKYFFRRKENNYFSYIQPTDLKTEGDSKTLLALAQLQSLENEYLTNLLTMYSLTLRQPVVRIPQMASALFGRMRELRQSYRQRSFATFDGQLRRLGSELWAQIPTQLQNLILHRNSDSIKLVSDLPLEWLDVDGVPLMYRTQVSRLPLTTLNILQGHYQMSSGTVHFESKHLDKIAIANCLALDDPLHAFPSHLSTHLVAKDIQHNYKVIGNVAEYRTFIEETQPAILIHFGHGSYVKEDDIGYLHIGHEKTKIWDFSPSVMPPIVLLGACETAAIAETHNTPATAFLVLGARTVLATYLPVQIDLTIVLYTRIIANLVEAIKGKQRIESWEQLVWKTLVLNRYLDFVLPFNEWRVNKGLSPIPDDFFSEYTYRWNTAEFLSLADGYQKCTTVIGDALGHFNSELATSFREFSSRTKVVPHTMFFTQLGSPESILLHKNDGPPADDPEIVRAYWGRRTEQDRNSI